MAHLGTKTTLTSRHLHVAFRNSTTELFDQRWLFPNRMTKQQEHRKNKTDQRPTATFFRRVNDICATLLKTSVHPHHNQTERMKHHRSRHHHLNMKQTHRNHGEPARLFRRTVLQTNAAKNSFPGLKTHHTDHGDVHRNQQWAQQPTRQDVL